MDSEKEVKIFKALGDPTRLRIIEMLSSGEKCVCKIIPNTGKSQPTVSAHLKILYEAGLVKYRKEGISVYYSLADKKIKNLLQLSKKINNKK